MREQSAGSLEMTLLRSWAVEFGLSTSSMILRVISGSVAMWLISRIALETDCSLLRGWTVMGASRAECALGDWIGALMVRLLLRGRDVAVWRKNPRVDGRAGKVSITVAHAEEGGVVGVGLREEGGDARTGAAVAEGMRLVGDGPTVLFQHGVRGLRRTG